MDIFKVDADLTMVIKHPSQNKKMNPFELIKIYIKYSVIIKGKTK